MTPAIRLAKLPNILTNFFERNLFERIIVYLFLSEFIVKLVFEIALGQWAYLQPRNKQWIFYALLGLDYLISFRKIIQLRVSFNAISLFTLLLLTMILHGLFIGFLYKNSLFAILNDFVPLTMMTLNILRMQSLAESSKAVDFKFLLYITTALAASTCLLSAIGTLIGLRSAITIPVNSIFCPLILAAAFKFRPFPLVIALLIITMIIFSLSELNRTTMAFFVIVIIGYILKLLLKSPSNGLIILMLSSLIACTAVLSLPKDSSTYQRILGLKNIDFGRRTGSIGERAAEYDSIRKTIAAQGKTQNWVGLGFGGVYELQATHQYVKDYGHAHYAWAWFNLRFGYFGYLYLSIFITILIINCVRAFAIGSNVGIFIGLLCVMGLLYSTTYVNILFLSNGIHFMRLKPRKMN